MKPSERIKQIAEEMAEKQIAKDYGDDLRSKEYSAWELAYRTAMIRRFSKDAIEQFLDEKFPE